MSYPQFDNSYIHLPDRFFARVDPTPVATPRLIRLNSGLAEELRLDAGWLASPVGIDMLSGNRLPDNAEPIAAAYAGHQFGQFVPQLGDGRAILLGEVIDRDGARRDIQLKGSGPTPFSRRGDGRAALGPVLREYVVSEAMAALGIPTTRALAAVTTGDTVARETLLPGAVLTRVASSHIRVGTFQFFAARGDVEGVRILADYVIARHYPNAAESPEPYRALLDAVIAAQADLVAQWLLVGFIHGVMNTDNMSVAGETIDYGPCAFMDTYDLGTVFSAIDQNGRYAYGNQPSIAQWNLTRLAEALLPVLAEDQDSAVARAQEALDVFATRFKTKFHAGMRRKIGLVTEQDGDVTLVQDLLKIMAENGADYTLTFRRLSDAASGAKGDKAVRSLFGDPTSFDGWASNWRQRLGQEQQDDDTRRAAMNAVNPAYIPRNHQIEAMISAAVEQDDFGPFGELMEVLSRPYEDQPSFARYAEPPQPHERVLQTFCGT
ncbi:YdiU family protein [Mesorhizobium sp. NBSH29]|uniref:protein adenylyltransferase SelO n=1 Tax=Mesorhizobium sp. NBSH29 TaxID=2654249 RepID=UPI001896469B|nr:YdiU family protein [Mesorhizobium sp. NBSH29]QPC88616.1 YdiU family protein [Mesorhizobium sp. NBSH29]